MFNEVVERRSLEVGVELIVSAPSVIVLATISHDVVKRGSCVFIVNPVPALAESFSSLSRVDTGTEFSNRNSDVSATAVTILEGSDL